MSLNEWFPCENPAERLYNQAIRIARQAVMMMDLDWAGYYTKLSMWEHWKYGYSSINEWNERRPSFYALATLNRLYRNNRQLKRPASATDLAETVHAHSYIRNDNELIIILWAPYEKTRIDLVVEGGWQYPVKIDLFDYHHLTPLDCQTAGDTLVIRDIPVYAEPYIIRCLK